MGFITLSLRRKQLNNSCFFIGKYLSKYTRRGARVVEEARLESVYTPKGYPGFESPSLRRLRSHFLISFYYFLLSANLSE